MSKREYVDPKEMIALEEELASLKKEYGIKEKETWWMRIGDRIAQYSRRSSRKVDRKKYIRLALCCGWFSGAHRFYAGQKWKGLLYLAFCWTGIPFAMTLIDLMIAIPIQPDDGGMITL